MLQSVFQGKETLTLIQFSSLKTQVFSAFPKLFFFVCVQFSNHTPDMSIERVSFPFLFRGFHSFIFRCFFSLLVLREIVLLMVFCHMSCLSADETFSIFHQLVSFFNTQRVDIHSIGILFSSEKSSVRRSGLSLTLICVCSSHYPHHPPPLMVELCGPIIPIFQLFGRGRSPSWTNFRRFSLFPSKGFGGFSLTSLILESLSFITTSVIGAGVGGKGGGVGDRYRWNGLNDCGRGSKGFQPFTVNEADKSSAWKSSPVRFFGLFGQDRDQDRSIKLIHLEKPDRDCKRPQNQSFAVFLQSLDRSEPVFVLKTIAKIFIFNNNNTILHSR